MVAISVSTVQVRNTKAKRVTVPKILKFYLPLTMTSMLTTLTHSLFNAGLARLPSPEMYISAFAVAKSLMHLLESPVHMIRQTVTALVEHKQSYYQVRSFVIRLAALVGALFLLMIITSSDRWILHNVMGMDGATLAAATTIFRVLMLFPFAASLRNFMQGILIKFQATAYLTIATVVRIIFVGFIVLMVDRLTMLPGAVIAGSMFLSAISMEALVLVVGCRISIGPIAKRFNSSTVRNYNRPVTDLSNHAIYRFFTPLVLTSFIGTTVMPIVNIGLAKTDQPEIAISSFAVAWGLGMIVLSPLMMFHQVPLNYADESDPTTIQVVRTFAILLGSLLALILLGMSFTPIGAYILQNWIGASQEITDMSIDVLRLMSVLPLLVVTREFYWGTLIKKRQTKYLSKGKTVNIIALTSAVLVLSFMNFTNPAVVGALSILICDSAEVVYLYTSAKRHEGDVHAI